MDLASLLHKTFGFDSFRANQEAVCRAATEGHDVLLVMPTGAGKSLCYQLPAIARGGTALVISPLIALMDDQATKLSALGLRVGRIHSGLAREEARQTCRDYLDGTLQFLFIAPERLRVPGFPEMLARRKPALIAIDEAHCISAWGHDFRPDYRTLGDHLPSLRPAPVIALTATATPTVQRDIIAQLKLEDPALFIHGFRRTNLAVEVVEMSKPRRNEFTVKLLAEKASRPAIVYAPSRKAAEELASQLGGIAAAYHAGLDPATRERVQRHFLSGDLEVVVATIAFGMGIDKPNVRTVIHTALPGSVEQYYQEIGRAGRDGQPSRTILLHSFADRKMHEFFLARDYPEPSELTRVAAVLTLEFQMPEILRQRLKMDVETFDTIVGKLVAQNAASLDIAGNVRAAGTTDWRSGYEAQLAFRRSQIELMAAFAETPQCRMAALVQHFGDTADGLRTCGKCDFCSPERGVAQTFREPTAHETTQLGAILAALAGRSQSTGKLHAALALGVDRKQFDAYLDALTRAGLIAITPDTFTNAEGKAITYKRAALTHEGQMLGASDPLSVMLKDVPAGANTRGRAHSGRAQNKSASLVDSSASTHAQRHLEVSLRAWRKAEAGKTGKPAFLVLSDAALLNIAAAQPRTIPELLGISGIGPDKASRYGAEICALCTSHAVSTNFADTSASEVRPMGMKAKTSSKPIVRDRKEHAHEAHTGAAIETFHRPHHHAPDPSESLTPEQQALDQRLRDWRKSESEKLGLPQFFVLASSTLRNIVLAHPKTMAQLRAIHGLGLDKLERFGPGILQVCTT